MKHEHDWQISVLIPVGWPTDQPIPMDAPTATYCPICGVVFTVADMEETNEADRWHLVIENDNGEPYISGCDCALARDHYDIEEVTA